MLKDEILVKLSETSNIAQFTSFGPDGVQRYSRVAGFEPDHLFTSIEEAAETMLVTSPEKSVNVRSFEPDSPKSREFLYGLKDAGEVASQVRRLAASGLYTIINETVDINDGGVSGVSLGGVVEFAPKDTPRCVEKPGILSMDRTFAQRLFHTVYGFRANLPSDPNLRVEFSIHPIARGASSEHTIIWEMEEMDGRSVTANIQWPNRYSEMIGDKAFGLLMAFLYGFNVPTTTVISRDVAPFTFGDDTGENEIWIRTAPRIQTPGKFSTFRGWRDPFALLHEEDPTGKFLAGVISQQAVWSSYAGATLTQPDGQPLIEGKRGYGDAFMLGESLEKLPDEVVLKVRAMFDRIQATLGPSRFEWVFDNNKVWIVQFHQGFSVSQGNVIVPGEPDEYVYLDVRKGLETLRDLIGAVMEGKPTRTSFSHENPKTFGVVLVGDVGVTSHMGDVLRKSGIPSKISPRAVAVI